MMLILLSALSRLALAMIVTYKLSRWKHMLNKIECLGLGIIGGSSFMTVPVILDRYKEGTPFDTWAGLLFTFGVTLYLLGRLSRHIRHEKRNEMAVGAATEHMARRGRT